jgi:predicted site-specific integrase-resolvase
MPEKYYSISKTAKMLGVTVKTVNVWSVSGKIKYSRTLGRDRRYSESEINRILGKTVPKNKCVIYARVSSTKQKNNGNLERQKERLVNYATDHGYELVDVLTETASGLNEERKKFHKMLDIIEDRKADVVLIETKDRLTRFGFKYIERFANHFGARIEVVEQKKVKSAQEELVKDLIAIITSFSSKIYGIRSQKFKQIKKELKDDADNG